MKTRSRSLWLLLTAATTAVLDLSAPGQAPVGTLAPPGQIAPVRVLSSSAEAPPVNHPEFDLVFRGGTVREFVDAVSLAVGQAVNVILNPELSETEIPPMKLRGVTVPRLFDAVAAASQKTMPATQANGGMGAGAVGGWQQGRFQYSHGFRTTDRVPSTDSVWVFYREDPPTTPPAPAPSQYPPQPPSRALTPPPTPPAPPEVRVLNLTPILEGRSIDDVTTAIRTASDMLEESAPPKLTFHKETNLLMLRGTPAQLEVMERVLKELAAAPAPAKRGTTPVYSMSPELMKRYGLMPSPATPTPAPEPAPKRQ